MAGVDSGRVVRQGCVASFSSLISVGLEIERSVPLLPVEPLTVCLDPSASSAELIGRIRAPPNVTTGPLAFVVPTQRLHRDRRVRFQIIPSGSDINDVDALASLAASVLVDATLHSATVSREAHVQPPSLPQPRIPYVPSVTRGCVEVTFPLPSDSLPGSYVVVSRVLVAGCEVSLGAPSVRIFTGCNHARAPAGPVSAAARTGSVSALFVALEGGGSTGERDVVRVGYCACMGASRSRILLVS
jgi:hypothetical protein